MSFQNPYDFLLWNTQDIYVSWFFFLLFFLCMVINKRPCVCVLVPVSISSQILFFCIHLFKNTHTTPLVHNTRFLSLLTWQDKYFYLWRFWEKRSVAEGKIFSVLSYCFLGWTSPLTWSYRSVFIPYSNYCWMKWHAIKWLYTCVFAWVLCSEGTCLIMCVCVQCGLRHADACWLPVRASHLCVQLSRLWPKGQCK